MVLGGPIGTVVINTVHTVSPWTGPSNRMENTEFEIRFKVHLQVQELIKELWILCIFGFCWQAVLLGNLFPCNILIFSKFQKRHVYAWESSRHCSPPPKKMCQTRSSKCRKCIIADRFHQCSALIKPLRVQGCRLMLAFNSTSNEGCTLYSTLYTLYFTHCTLYFVLYR